MRQRAVFLVLLLAALSAAAGERLSPVDPKTVTIGGEIGRRIDLTIEKNLLALEHFAEVVVVTTKNVE